MRSEIEHLFTPILSFVVIEKTFFDRKVQFMNENQLLTATQVGLMLALSKQQIFRLNSSGKLPRPIKIGGVVRWLLTDIARWQILGCPDRREFEALKEDTAMDGLSMAVQLILLALQLPEHDEELRQVCYHQLEHVLRGHYEKEQ